MGTPYFKAKRELEAQGVVVRSSNYALYADMSQRLMSLLESQVEELEVYSIDEAFARISRPADGDLRPWGRRMRALARRNLGLPIAIGLGASKGQAKLANRLAKVEASHAGLFDLGDCDDGDHWLETIAIEDVGHRPQAGSLVPAARCPCAGTARHGQRTIAAKAGVVGLRLQRELQGHTRLPLDLTPAPKQETCVSCSFSRPVIAWRNCAKPWPPTWCERPKNYVGRINGPQH